MEVKLIRGKTANKVVLSFSNFEDEDVTLALPRACSELDGNYFQFSPAFLLYAGEKTQNKLTYSDEECLVLHKGEQISFEVDLSKYYDLPQDPSRYTVTYSAGHPVNGVGKEIYKTLKSNSVRLYATSE